MKIIFNIDKDRFEVHNFNFVESSLIAASIIGGVSFWVIAIIMLVDPSYQ